jgi:hypothetical protein
MKKIFNLFLMMAIATTISLTSCKTDGCTDPTASNYDEDADNDDGSCIINGCTDATATNFSIKATNDDGSCSFERDAFIGTYNNSVDGCDSGSSFNMTISESSENTSTISISNFGGFGSFYSIKATVNGNNISLISGSLGNGITLLNGSGSIVGNILTIVYTYEDSFGTETCQITAVK